MLSPNPASSVEPSLLLQFSVPEQHCLLFSLLLSSGIFSSSASFLFTSLWPIEMIPVLFVSISPAPSTETTQWTTLSKSCFNNWLNAYIKERIYHFLGMVTKKKKIPYHYYPIETAFYRCISNYMITGTITIRKATPACPRQADISFVGG